MKRRATPARLRALSARRLVRIALRGWDGDRCWRAIHVLRMRGSAYTLALARSLAASASWRRRALGLYIASQLQQRRREGKSSGVAYALDETRELLLSGLRDPHDEVVGAAASGLGHRPHPAALHDLVRLASHPNASLRFDVAFALGNHDEPAAVEALLILACDSADEVRDWATFGLGSLHEADTPQIRERLWLNLRDPVADVRGEAIVGLAQRHDPRAIDHLLTHLDDDCRIQELHAAEKLASPRLLPALQVLLARSQGRADIDGSWFSNLCAAVEACGGAPVSA